MAARDAIDLILGFLDLSFVSSQALDRLIHQQQRVVVRICPQVDSLEMDAFEFGGIQSQRKGSPRRSGSIHARRQNRF